MIADIDTSGEKPDLFTADGRRIRSLLWTGWFWYRDLTAHTPEAAIGQPRAPLASCSLLQSLATP